MIIGLQGEFNFRGFVIYNAFSRIDTTQSSDKECTLSVNIYASKKAYDDGESYLEQLSSVKFLKNIGESVADDRTQGYEFISKMAEFKEWFYVSE